MSLVVAPLLTIMAQLQASCKALGISCVNCTEVRELPERKSYSNLWNQDILGQLIWDILILELNVCLLSKSVQCSRCPRVACCKPWG